ncbi:RNAse E [Aliiroseovarius halocynthiae]|uniref:Ribonuclease E n=1 Tax=Aliiroseovarius halocynthiae TaxID=985055 RepID=A0A545SVD5_9RHOB|nr:ribonuclease E/G [Aliiroseovarius halocynthiae]TQV68935.1 Rne/Rng family ribonuclease [Aliiroseovarius halocynthiae]SMR71570.1 RNAse E [Aliiroseovarius halocynthiae]
MAKKMLIDATHAEETRVVVVDGNKVEEFDFESENKRQLAGNIYLAKVTRVEPSLQAAFVDYGGNRHGFLAFSEIHPDYYQIPVADREALLEEERAYAEAMAAEEDKPKSRRRRRSRSRSKAEETKTDDAVATKELDQSSNGMDVIDLDEGGANADEGHSPMDLVADTPVEEPAEAADTEAEDNAAKDADAETTSDDDASAADATKSDEDVAPAEAQHVSDEDEADSDSDSDDDEDEPLEASEKDDQIERVADDDSSDDIRPRRKPRPKRYKIQEVIKVRQILLVQVVKEERGNKGAALTTYLSLAGRYCVLMPNTARGGGISRKITNASDRKKLKEIAAEIDVPKGAGLIVRTAGAKRTKSEIKRDYEYLQRLWEQIRELTLNSIAPAKIYEEGNLIKRTIRDLYSREIDEVFVEGEAGYRVAKDFMKMIMPSHAKNVKHYQDAMPLFARYQVESYLSGMFNPTVQLKSGGYIVIGVTEALVAIDVNSGRATKEGSIEETALKTNLEAAEEVARQLRLRDLAGLIVIDFIDMDERRNNNAVEKRMKDKLKTDRARIQVGRISGFGLMEMSRQRLRPGMIEATTQPCNHCHGTGLIRSDDNLALNILRQLEEEGVRRRSREVLVKAPIGIVNFLMNNKREHIAQIEARYGMSVRIEADPFLISPDYTIEKFKTATRIVPEAAPVVSVDASIMADIDDVEEAEVISDETPEAEGEGKPKKRRRRRRRRRGRGGDDQQENGQAENGEAEEVASEADAKADDASGAEDAPKDAADEAPEEKPKRKRATRSRKKKTDEVAADVDAADAVSTESVDPEAAAEEEKPKKPVRKRRTSKAKAEEDAKAAEAEASDEAKPEASEEAKEEKPKRKRASRAKKPKADEAPAEVEADAKTEEAPAEEEKPKKPARKRAPRKKAEPVAEEAVSEPAEAPVAEPAPVPVEAAVAEAPTAAPEPAPVAEVAPDEPPKPKRKGWWSLNR